MGKYPVPHLTTHIRLPHSLTVKTQSKLASSFSLNVVVEVFERHAHGKKVGRARAKIVRVSGDFG